jgi:solute carrier family 9B (sodium/hydrogen exchanger), member 1/2
MGINLFIVIFFIGGWAFNRIFTRCRLPGILGMVIFGIMLKFFMADLIPHAIWEMEPFLKSIALIVILLRAGLGISRRTLQKVGKTALLMSFVPCFVEAAGLTVAFHFFFDLGWAVSALFSFVLSAVSPAVVVPSMLEMKKRGHGAKNDVPTMILASTSADDVVAITCFSLFLAVTTGNGGNIAGTMLAMPLSIIVGIVAGLAVGSVLSRYFVKKHKKIRATEKTLLLLMIGLLVVEIGNALHIAAFLAVMTIGFVVLEKAEHVAHELAQKLSKVWIIAEIVLFVLIGMAVDPFLAVEHGAKGIAVIVIGLAFRSVGVLMATAFDRALRFKERVFCVIAFVPKATVQAALGSIPLAAGVAGGGIILSIAVLAILFTAPLGLLLIHKYGPGLLDG